MEVFEVVKMKGTNDKMVNVNMSDLECKMLLTFALNELINRGSLTLLSPEDQEKLKGLEDLLTQDAQGSA